MKHARIEKGRRGSTKPLRELEDWNFYRKNEVLGLLRFLIVVAFVVQLMVEFGPHNVAP
ncbi:MAG: hypothetical protein KDB03_04940 [Planctomycetales bacterium]|nr:hypothetical protein [Planctomycetales bacterium]